MNSFKAVFKRELKGYFATPLAYVFLVIFLFFSGYLAFKEGFYAMRQGSGPKSERSARSSCC